MNLNKQGWDASKDVTFGSDSVATMIDYKISVVARLRQKINPLFIVFRIGLILQS